MGVQHSRTGEEIDQAARARQRRSTCLGRDRSVAAIGTVFGDSPASRAASGRVNGIANYLRGTAMSSMARSFSVAISWTSGKAKFA